LEVVRWLGGSVPEFRTMEEVQERLTEAQTELAEAEERAERASGRNAAAAKRRVAERREEIAELEKKLDVMRRIAAIEQGEAARSPGASGAGTAARPRGAATAAEDWRTRTPEEIGAALSDFRSGRISQWQLAERAGLSPPGTDEAIRKEQTAMAAGVPISFAPGDFDERLREYAAKMPPIRVPVEPVLLWEDNADQVGGRD
jgi:hypothetical protein